MDGLDGADIDAQLLLADVGLCVRLAGVVDISGGVLADGAVDGPAVGDLEQVFVVDRVVLLVL